MYMLYMCTVHVYTVHAFLVYSQTLFQKQSHLAFYTATNKYEQTQDAPQTYMYMHVYMSILYMYVHVLQCTCTMSCTTY